MAKYEDSVSGAKKALGDMSIHKVEHMHKAIPDSHVKGTWQIHVKHPKHGSSVHQVYLAGHGTHRHDDFETMNEAVEDETKKYYEPKAPAEKAMWMQHKVRKYTQPGIDDDQFSGKTSKDKTRKLDQDEDKPDNGMPSELGPVTLPSYMKTIKNAIAGVREETIDEAFPPKKDGPPAADDSEDPKKKKKKSKNPFDKSGNDNDSEDEDNDDDTDGDEDEEKTKDGEVAPEDADQEDETDEDDEEDDAAGKDDAAENGVGVGIPGKEAKPQLEQIAIQAAEIFAEMDENGAYDSEVKEAIEAAVEAIAKIHSKVMNDEGDEDTNTSDGDQKKTPSFGQGDGVDDQKKVSEEYVSEISKTLARNYLSKLDNRDFSTPKKFRQHLGTGGPTAKGKLGSVSKKHSLPVKIKATGK